MELLVPMGMEPVVDMLPVFTAVDPNVVDGVVPVLQLVDD